MVALRGIQVGFQTRLRLAVIAERVQRLRRHGVHRVRSDQLLDVQHVGVSRDPWCWCWPTARAASARPSSPERPNRRPKKSPCSADKLACALAMATLPSRLFSSACSCGSVAGFQLGLHHRVHHAVDAADEKAGDAGDVAWIAAAGDVLLQAQRCRPARPFHTSPARRAA